jgi:hypothetical protein
MDAISQVIDPLAMTGRHLSRYLFLCPPEGLSDCRSLTTIEGPSRMVGLFSLLAQIPEASRAAKSILPIL